MKKAIFFDLDGTLWDSLKQVTIAYNMTMENQGKQYRFEEKDIKKIMGLTPEETVSVLFPEDTFEEGLKLFKACYATELLFLKDNPGILYPKVKETLEILKKKYHLYIVSNADRGYIETFIKSCKMQNYFDAFVQAGDTGLAKWENIIYLKKREKVDEIVYIGDTAKDKLETEKAKERFIHANYGFGQVEDCIELNRFEDLPQIIEKIF